jgi:DNA polymerase
VNTQEALRHVLEFYQALGVSRLPLDLPDSAPLRPADKAAALEELKLKFAACGACRLSKARKTVVFGEGSPDARLLFIGEGPGREEDLQGRPFVGDAGKLLTRLINRMGFQREEVYIANVVKCRPPMNRDPQEDEVAACMPVLQGQIEIIAPAAIMLLGRVAAQAVLETKVPISKLRGKFTSFRGIPVMPTFHPAYLLRNPKEKMLVWADAQQVLEKLGMRTE